MIIASTYSQDNVRGADATVNVLSSPVSVRQSDTRHILWSDRQEVS